MPEKFKDRINKSFNMEKMTMGDLLEGRSGNPENVYTAIAGINNQMKYSKAVADLIFKNNGHFLYALEYFAGKIIPLSYTFKYKRDLKENKNKPGDDIMNILNGYNQRGYDVKANDFIIGSAASILLSSTTWSFVYSAFTELPKGSFLVHAPVWHGWRLPDLNFYATTQGLSFEVIMGYQFNENWYTGLTTEFVYKGNTAFEFGPTLGYSLNTSVGQFDLSTQLIVSNEFDFGGNAGLEWTSPCKDWTVGLKYIYHNALTLVGERNIPFLCSGFMNGGEPSHTNHEINITLSYNY